MSKSNEVAVMKQALEAFTKVDAFCPVGSNEEIYVRDAIYAITEALAKQSTKCVEQGEPQQRPSRSDIKPLTDEQIEALWHEDTSCDMPDELKQFKHTARAIEAAHGIKSGTAVKE